MRLNPRVIERMFTTPVRIFKTSRPNSVGDVTTEESFDLSGYVFDSMVVIENSLGIKEISTRQIYLPMRDIDKVDASMKVSCKDSTKARIIKRAAYGGPHSTTLIGVLYLP